jgi:deoxyadenosine/deoxycytidine kinase
MMIVFLEACPGSGKTSCAEFLRKEYAVFVEPVEMWSNHLHGVYGPNSADWALPMQMLALTTRHELLLRAVDLAERTGKPVVVERSPRSDSIFAQDLEGTDMGAYLTVRARYDELMAGLDKRYIYMRADPEICMGRIAVRGRPQERSMTLERAKEMHRRHDLEFEDDVTVDANREKQEVFNDVLELIRSYERGAGVPP